MSPFKDGKPSACRPKHHVTASEVEIKTGRSIEKFSIFKNGHTQHYVYFTVNCYVQSVKPRSYLSMTINGPLL
jgi:hypothetical protein